VRDAGGEGWARRNAKPYLPGAGAAPPCPSREARREGDGTTVDGAASLQGRPPQQSLESGETAAAAV